MKGRIDSGAGMAGSGPNGGQVDRKTGRQQLSRPCQQWGPWTEPHGKPRDSQKHSASHFLMCIPIDEYITYQMTGPWAHVIIVIGIVLGPLLL